MKKLVIIPGGFHPFHAGHKALYDAAREAFPSAEVYIAATADTSTRPFPIEAKKKLARLAGIPQNRFIQVKSPFSAKEITDHYDPDNTVLIFARSEKDRETNPQAGGVKRDGTPSYLQPFKRNGLQPMKRHAYMTYLPTVQFGPGISSATEIRAKWPEMDPKQKARLVNQLYPDTEGNAKLTSVVVRLFDETLGGSAQPEKELNEVDIANAADAEFYRELLAVTVALTTPAVVGAYYKAREVLRLYQANKILAALEGRGIQNISAQDRQQIETLIKQFKQAAAEKNGSQAKQVATQIQRIATNYGVSENQDYIDEVLFAPNRRV